MSNKKIDSKPNIRNLRLTAERMKQLNESKDNPFLQQFLTITGKWQWSKLFDVAVGKLLTNPEMFEQEGLFLSNENIKELIMEFMNDQRNVNSIILTLFKEHAERLDNIDKKLENQFQNAPSGNTLFDNDERLILDLKKKKDKK